MSPAKGHFIGNMGGREAFAFVIERVHVLISALRRLFLEKILAIYE